MMPEPSVRDQLAAAQRAHRLYEQHSPRMVANGVVVERAAGDPDEALRYLKEAARARAQAEVIDPTHSDPAWAAEAAQFPHQELLVFYLQQLSR